MVSRNSKTGSKSVAAGDIPSGWRYGSYLPRSAKNKYDQILLIIHNNKVIIGNPVTHIVKFKRRHFNPKMTPNAPLYVETDITGKVTPDELRMMDFMGEIVLEEIPLSAAKKLIPDQMYRSLKMWLE